MALELIEICGLKKDYKNFDVLKELDMTVGSGEVYGFIGRNSCGKSTTMSSLACRYPGGIAGRTTEVIGGINLSGAERRRIGGYSCGMKQRVGMGAAIYANYDIIVLDEPTSALDPAGCAEVIQIIKALKQMEKRPVVHPYPHRRGAGG